MTSSSEYDVLIDAGWLTVSVYVVDTEEHARATEPLLARKAEGIAAYDDHLRGRSERCGRILVAATVYLVSPAGDEAEAAGFLSDTIDAATRVLDASHGPC